MKVIYANLVFCSVIGIICKENEHFVRHNPFCPITCENRFLTSPFEQCKPQTGCFCDYGYVRLHSNATGPCIPDDSCRKYTYTWFIIRCFLYHCIITD